MTEDIYRNGEKHPLEEPLKIAQDNLRSASCRHSNLVQNLQLTKLPKKFCKYVNDIAINSKTNATKYVLSILKHAKKNIARILRELESLKHMANSCDFDATENDTESSKANLERKNLRNTQMQDDGNVEVKNSQIDRRIVRSSLSPETKGRRASRVNSKDENLTSKRKRSRKRGRKSKRRHRKRNCKSRRRDKSNRKSRKQRHSKCRRNRKNKNKKDKKSKRDNKSKSL